MECLSRRYPRLLFGSKDGPGNVLQEREVQRSVAVTWHYHNIRTRGLGGDSPKDIIGFSLFPELLFAHRKICFSQKFAKQINQCQKTCAAEHAEIKCSH